VNCDDKTPVVTLADRAIAVTASTDVLRLPTVDDVCIAWSATNCTVSVTEDSNKFKLVTVDDKDVDLARAD